MNSLKTLKELKEGYLRIQPCFGQYEKSINCSFCSRMKDDV